MKAVLWAVVPKTALLLLLCTLLVFLSLPVADAFHLPVPQPSDFPSKLTLRTAAIEVVPFFLERNDTTTTTTTTAPAKFEGFIPDLLDALVEYAKRDNVTLEFTIEGGPQLYNTALNWLATDCNTTDNPNSLEDCSHYDLIVGDYWPNPPRYERVNFTPRWLETGLCTMKYVGPNKQGKDYTTLTEAAQAGVKVCTLDGSTLPDVLANNFPTVQQVLCPTNEACIQDLKAEKCSLFTQDYLTLLYRSLRDPTVEVTKELFQTQPIVFPLRKDLDPIITYLLQRWLYWASYEATFDNLFAKYFSVQLCPIGTAGPNCDLPCDPTHGSSGPNGECICESTKWYGDDCSIERMEELNRIPQPIKIAGYTMLGTNCLLVLVWLGWLIYNRRMAQVQVAQPFFLVLILVGCIISTSTIIPLSLQDDPGNGNASVNAACMAAPWLYSVGWCVTFGSVFAKIRRVRLLFESSAGFRRARVTTSETLGIIGIILFIDVTILLLWTILDPLEWTREIKSADKFGNSLESEAYCTCQHWKAWAGSILALHGSLLVFASYSCYVSRNISTAFSEAKYLAIAMVSNLQMFLVGLPVLVIVGSDPGPSHFAKCAMIFINDFMVVALIFGNFAYQTHVGRFSLRTTNSMVNVTMQEYASNHSMNSSVMNNNSSKRRSRSLDRSSQQSGEKQQKPSRRVSNTPQSSVEPQAVEESSPATTMRNQDNSGRPSSMRDVDSSVSFATSNDQLAESESDSENQIDNEEKESPECLPSKEEAASDENCDDNPSTIKELQPNQ